MLIETRGTDEFVQLGCGRHLIRSLCATFVMDHVRHVLRSLSDTVLEEKLKKSS